jgi:hypothetical protein
MFFTRKQKMGLAIGVLVSAVGTSANSVAAGVSGVHYSDDQSIVASAQPAIFQESHQATRLQSMSIHDLEGTSATVAVIDTGMSERASLSEAPDDFLRLLATCGAEAKMRDTPQVAYGESAGKEAACQQASGEPSWVVARASSGEGATSAQDAIRVIEWVVSNKDKYQIGALDLSFVPPTTSTRGDDPLNQAVMAAWEAEIVVVSSADTVGI